MNILRNISMTDVKTLFTTYLKADDYSKRIDQEFEKIKDKYERDKKLAENNLKQAEDALDKSIGGKTFNKPKIFKVDGELISVMSGDYLFEVERLGPIEKEL